jgi:hypothetical protein
MTKMRISRDRNCSLKIPELKNIINKLKNLLEKFRRDSNRQMNQQT